MGNTGNTTVFNNYYDTSDIAVINAGYQKKVDHSFGPYANNYHVLQYILDGQGVLRIGTNEWRLIGNEPSFKRRKPFISRHSETQSNLKV